ncbi:MAG: hypothetical protein R3244_09635 [Thermoanaerobaculia bacterium]|nr:hypothetical protein [Thermoanaerobaculia bacterium]
MRILLALSVAFGLVACGTEEPPVAELTIDPPELDLGYSEVRRLRLSWRLLAPLEGDRAGTTTLEGDPRVFVHLIDSPGDVLRTYDHQFPVAWSVGEEVEYFVEIHQSALGPPLKAGTYGLTVGLYSIDGHRWPLAVEGAEVDRHEYRVASIEVSPPSVSPVFRFSDSWRPIESGLDRQVLGRRWLIGEGSIWITRAKEVRAVWMELLVPTAEVGLSRLMLEEGANEPAVSIESACAGAELLLTGSGWHQVEVPVGRSDDETVSECEIVLRPNFELFLNGSLERRSVLLEGLAWSANGRY